MKKAAVIIDSLRSKEDLIKISQNHAQFLPSDWEVIIDQNPNIKSIMDYNMYLTSKSFWENINFDKILIFQHDSGLLKPGIEDFLEWDLVGAPWSFQEHGGNGGLTIRDRQAMIRAIEFEPYQPILSGNEDVYFSNVLKRMNANLAPREVCSKFSVESIFELGTVGYHAIDKYLTKEQTWQIINQYKN